MWTADIAVDEPLVRRLVGEQFPLFAGASIEPFGVGWDNAAFLIGGTVLFRFPRRRVAAGLIEREVALLPAIAPRVPVPISAPAYVGRPTEAYPWVFAGYLKLAGATACSVVLTEAERAVLGEELGAFLRALHGIAPEPLVARGLPPDEIGRLDHAKRLRMTRERLPGLAAAAGQPAEPVAGPALAPVAGPAAGPAVAVALASAQLDALVAWLEANPPEPPPDARRVLVHGDLYARHVLVDSARRLSGIIDWGDVHLGDPAIDIAIAHLMLPAWAHTAFRAAYGPIDERTWSAARYRAIYHAIVELDYGIREGDAGMRAIGLAALGLIAEALPR